MLELLLDKSEYFLVSPDTYLEALTLSREILF